MSPGSQSASPHGEPRAPRTLPVGFSVPTMRTEELPIVAMKDPSPSGAGTVGRCRACGAAALHRSRPRSRLEKWGAAWTPLLVARCHACSDRSWRFARAIEVALDRPDGWTPSIPPKTSTRHTERVTMRRARIRRFILSTLGSLAAAWALASMIARG